MTNLQKTVNQAIPVYFNKADFNKFILPHLWVGSRGPKPKLPHYKIFHYILYVLYTGSQWQMLPIERGADGKAEIHYTRICKFCSNYTTHSAPNYTTRGAFVEV
jgi:hypothetical protein